MSEKSFEDAVIDAKEFVLSEETKQKLAEFDLSGFDEILNSFSVVYWLVKRIVFAVENIYQEYHTITSEERIDVAARVLDDLIVFSGWASVLEFVDGAAFKFLISAVVSGLNDKHGNVWKGLSIDAL